MEDRDQKERARLQEEKGGGGMKLELTLPSEPNCFLCGAEIGNDDEHHIACEFDSTKSCNGTLVMFVCSECVRRAVEEKVGKRFLSIFQIKKEEELK